MANATASRLGQVNGADDANALFLKVFAGEVLAAFQRANKMLPITTVRTISSGKQATFPVTGKTTAAYHTVGNEINGTAIKVNEKVISIDDLLIADTFLSNIDEAKSHWDARAIFSGELGAALSRKLDQNLIQIGLQAARSSATVSGETGGSVITDADAHTSASSFRDSLYEAAQKLDEADCPEEDRYAVMTPDQYYLLLTDDKVTNRDFVQSNNFEQGKAFRLANMQIVKSNSAVSAFTDLSGASSAGHKNTYNGNYSSSKCVCFHKSAIGTVKNFCLDLWQHISETYVNSGKPKKNNFFMAILSQA